MPDLKVYKVVSCLPSEALKIVEMSALHGETLSADSRDF